MLAWLSANLINIVLIAVIVLITGMLVRSIIRDRKAGKPSCGGNCASCGGDPKAELVAVMQYMVKHNTAHAQELAALANKIKQLGDTTGYAQVMVAVSDFEKGNMRLSAVLAAMNIPQ